MKKFLVFKKLNVTSVRFEDITFIKGLLNIQMSINSKQGLLLLFWENAQRNLGMEMEPHGNHRYSPGKNTITPKITTWRKGKGTQGASITWYFGQDTWEESQTAPQAPVPSKGKSWVKGRRSSELEWGKIGEAIQFNLTHRCKRDYSLFTSLFK